MLPRKQILGELDAARSRLLGYMNSLPPESRTLSPSGAWSPVQVLEHLSLVESATLTGFRRAESSEDKRRRLSLRQRYLPVPVAVVRYTTLKAKAPSWVTPERSLTWDEALKTLECSRRDLRGYIESRTDEQLNNLAVRHPFFGWMSAAHGLRLVAGHELRHRDQLRRSLAGTKVKMRAAAA